MIDYLTSDLSYEAEDELIRRVKAAFDEPLRSMVEDYDLGYFDMSDLAVEVFPLPLTFLRT
jgi:hypothetical protein